MQTSNTQQHARAAGEQIGTFIEQAVEEIERVLGEGYARKNPAFLAELVRSQVAYVNGESLADALCEIADALKEGK